MKKFILISLVFIVSNKILQAQKSAEYGFLTGVNLNTVKGKNIISAENLGMYVGNSFGGYYKQNFSEKWKPAKNEGESVKSKFTIPLTISLSE